jgi:N-ethylmaleimide reductase
MSKLLKPLTVADLQLPNRVVMAPLTRNRAAMPGRVPNGLMRATTRSGHRPA